MGVIIQRPMYVSNEAYIGILTGAYKITGGVVRHARGKYKGRIVEHLKPADIKDADQAKRAVQQGAKAGGKVLAEIKKVDKRLIVVAGVAAAAVAAGATIYYIASGREPKEVKSFRKALGAYIKAAEKGNIKMKDVAELEKALDKLASRKDFDNLCVLLDAQGIDQLARLLIAHTSQMVEDNPNIIDFEAARKLHPTGTPLQDLSNCLEVQRMLFERAAS